MKSGADANVIRRLSRHDGLGEPAKPFPQTAFSFQPRRFDGIFGDSHSPRRRPGFTNLAREVLRSDASRSFRLETAVLGLVTLVCIWPIAVMIHEVIRLLR